MKIVAFNAGGSLDFWQWCATTHSIDDAYSVLHSRMKFDDAHKLFGSYFVGSFENPHGYSTHSTITKAEQDYLLGRTEALERVNKALREERL